MCFCFPYLGPQDDACIELAFSKNQADARKEWLNTLTDDTFIDHTAGPISYSDFINKELILFSYADNCRSIPSMVDGLKPGQRKILFACFKRKLIRELKVAQLAGYVSEHSAYHHGNVTMWYTAHCSSILFGSLALRRVIFFKPHELVHNLVISTREKEHNHGTCWAMWARQTQYRHMLLCSDRIRASQKSHLENWVKTSI